MNVFKPFPFVLIVVFICSSFLYASDDNDKKNSSAGVAIGISAGAVITGAAIYFITKHVKGDRLQGDSIITFVEQSIDSSERFYEQYKFDLSGKYLQRILPQYDQYEKYCHKRHRSAMLNRDSIVNKIFYCQLLHNLHSMIRESDSLALNIPIQAEQIVELNRHEINNTVNKILAGIKQLEERYKDNREVIRYGFRKSIGHINSIDSVMNEVYESEKLNFSMKCRYFFNRAIENKDTVALEHFVNDCDYYSIDKEWCARARSILTGVIDSSEFTKKMISTKTRERNSGVKKIPKFSQIDSIHNEFRKAMESKNIDTLQSYVSKYQKKNFRKKDTRIDSAIILLDSLKKQFQKENTFIASHPLLSDSSAQNMKILVNGLQGDNEFFFREGILSLQDQFKQVYGIREPVLLTIEKKESTLQFFLTAYVRPSYDISKSYIKDTTFYTLSGILWSVDFLHAFRSYLYKKATEDKYINPSLKEYLLGSQASVYVVRLKKNNDENITMYAYKNEDKPVFYEFFDISSKKEKNIRVDNKTAHGIQVVGSSMADSLKSRLISGFLTSD